MPSSSLPEGKTPYQLYKGENPNYSQLRVFGYTAYILNYQAKTHGKLAARSHAGVLLGYAAKNQWLIWDRRSVKVRQDVVFDEDNLHYYKPNVVEMPVGEPLTNHDVFTQILQETPPPTPESLKIILPLGDDPNNTFIIRLVRTENGGGTGENERIPGEDPLEESTTPTPSPPNSPRRRPFARLPEVTVQT